ncbi:hypothetical protein Hanom_Chr04g00364661 [Helianthus anomalus]
MLSTCLSNDSTIVWTRRSFTRGLLGTNQIACAQWRPCISNYSGSQLEVTGIDRFMSISELAALNYVNMLVIRKRFRTLYAISNLCTHLYIICIDFILTYVTCA